MTARALTAAAIVLALAPPAVAGEHASSGPLAIRAPDGLVLGRDATAALRLRAAPSAVLVTNTGTISPPIAAGDELAATLTLPTSRYPRVAIVAALGEDGAIVDWLAIPLAGLAQIKVDTEPGARVVARVAGTEYGPVQADARGVARFEVVVPPDVTEASTISTGRYGVKEKTIRLPERRFPRVLVACGPQADRVTVVATTIGGAPATVPPQVAVSAGHLGALVPRAPGVFETSYDPPAEIEDVVVVATTDSASDPGGTCALHIPPEQPAAVRLTADRPRFVAGTGTIALAVDLDYPGRRPPLSIETLALTTEVGSIDEPRRTPDGWTATWTLPDRFGGRPTARAIASVPLPGGRTLAGDVVLELAAGSPARIVATLPEVLVADGASSGDVIARVLDRWDNPVAVAGLRGQARGGLGRFIVQPDGAWMARYTAPRSRVHHEDTIVLVDPTSGVTARTTVALEPLPRQFAVSAGIGYLSNLGRIQAPFVALTGTMRLPLIREHLVVQVQLAVYSTSLRVPAMDTGESVSIQLSAAPALAGLAYRARLGPVDVWAGAGIGFAVVSSRLSSASAGAQRDTAVRPAAAGFVGTARRTGRGWIIVEGGYLHASLSDGPVTGRIGGAHAMAGYALEL